MIFTITLAAKAKQAQPGKVIQSNIKKICDNLKLSPDVSGMDVLLLTATDLKKKAALDMFTAAYPSKHPDVLFIYVYSKEAEADLVDADEKVLMKKPTAELVKKTLEELIQKKVSSSGKSAVSNQDFVSLNGTPQDEGTVNLFPTRSSSSKLNDLNDDDFELDDEEDDNSHFSLDDIQESAKSGRGPRDTIEDLPSYDNGGDMPDNSMFAQGEEAAPQFTDTLESDEAEDDTTAPTSNMLGSDTDDLASNPMMDAPKVSSAEAVRPDAPIFKQEADAHVDAPKMPPLGDQIYKAKPEEPGSVFNDKPIEEVLQQVNNTADFDIFRRSLTANQITRSLIKDNTEYQQLIQNIDIYDARINAVWRSDELSADQKLAEIKKIGLQKTAARESVNNEHVEKFLTILATIAEAATSVVDKKIETLSTSFAKLNAYDRDLVDSSQIAGIIEKRADVMLDLCNAQKALSDLYIGMADMADSEIRALSENIPTKSMLINDTLGANVSQVFLPRNTHVLANKIQKALAANTIKMSQVSGKITSFIDAFSRLYEIDNEIIQKQREQIDLLTANRVEDVVICDTVLKNCCTVFIGAKETGVHASALTYAGVRSRVRNTLVIDFTGKHKAGSYGAEAIDLAEFTNKHPEKQLCIIELEDKPDIEQIQRILDICRKSLNHYGQFVFILEDGQKDELVVLSQEALSINYVCNCTDSSIDVLKELVSCNITSNVARKIVLIDPMYSPRVMLNFLDFTRYKLVILPKLSEIATARYKGIKPWSSPNVVEIFEEVF